MSTLGEKAATAPTSEFDLSDIAATQNIQLSEAQSVKVVPGIPGIFVVNMLSSDQIRKIVYETDSTGMPVCMVSYGISVGKHTWFCVHENTSSDTADTVTLTVSGEITFFYADYPPTTLHVRGFALITGN